MEKDIFRMNLHDIIYVEQYQILRVSGGWIYRERLTEGNHTPVFVPFSKEFLN